MNLNILIGTCVVSAISAVAQESGIGIRATVYPTPAYIENLERGQSVATDFGIENKTAEKLTLKSITVSVFDNSGQLAFRKALNEATEYALCAGSCGSR